MYKKKRILQNHDSKPVKRFDDLLCTLDHLVFLLEPPPPLPPLDGNASRPKTNTKMLQCTESATRAAAFHAQTLFQTPWWHSKRKENSCQRATGSPWAPLGIRSTQLRTIPVQLRQRNLFSAISIQLMKIQMVICLSTNVQIVAWSLSERIKYALTLLTPTNKASPGNLTKKKVNWIFLFFFLFFFTLRKVNCQRLRGHDQREAARQGRWKTQQTSTRTDRFLNNIEEYTWNFRRFGVVGESHTHALCWSLNIVWIKSKQFQISKHKTNIFIFYI